MSLGGAIRAHRMAKDGPRLMRICATCCPLQYQIPAVVPIAFQCRPRPSQPFQRPFSQSTSTLLPRHQPNREGYPGFRNESKERRNVREHNLFDPQLQYSESAVKPPDTSGYTDYPQSMKRPPGTVPLEDTPPEELERELLYLSSRYPADPRVRNILLHLLYDKIRPPNAIQYEALILANASPQYGSADNLQNVIEEMERMEIPTNVNLYLAILRTLVVHPDVEILNNVIEACENQWIEIDSDMRHLICAAYLRAGMQEVALDYLEQIEYNRGGLTFGVPRSGLQRGQAELWLYVLFIQHFAQNNDWESVMRLCYRLYDDTSYGVPLASRHLDVPYHFWLSLLDQASSAKDKWVTFWIWENWVLKAWIHPSPETCLRVLEVCAENGAVRIAETVCVILRFLSKESSQQNPDLKDEAPPPTNQDIDTAKILLAQTHENAGPNEPRPSQTDIRRITAEWWIFDVEDKIGWGVGKAETRRTLRINPWATLRDVNDPGMSWARKLDHREAVMQKREEREALRQAHVRRAKIEAGYASMRRSLPAPLVADIEKAATAELDFEGTGADAPERSGQKLGPTKSKDAIQRPSRKPTTTDETEDGLSRPRIRLIDPESHKIKQSIENERIKQWLKLGLDIETAVKMDDQQGNRAWKLGDNEAEAKAEAEDQLKPDTVVNSSKSPSLRLWKLPETSPDGQWHSEWSQMLAARRRFEQAVQRKRQTNEVVKRKVEGRVETRAPKISATESSATAWKLVEIEKSNPPDATMSAGITRSDLNGLRMK